METLLSKEEREAYLAEREKRIERQYKTGRITVSIIGFLYIVFTIISAIVKFNIIGLVINISVACALFFGSKWAKVYYAVSVGFGIIIFLSILFNPMALSLLPSWAIILSLLQLVFGVISSIILFKSKSVIEFMETQRELPY